MIGEIRDSAILRLLLGNRIFNFSVLTFRLSPVGHLPPFARLVLNLTPDPNVLPLEKENLNQ